MKKEPTHRARLKLLRADLRYFQMQARLDARNLKLARGRVKEIGKKMRDLQHEMQSKNQDVS